MGRVRELERQRILSLCICICVRACVHMLDRATDREISLPQQVCPLALLNSIWGYRINLGKHASPSFSLLFLTPPDEDSVCSQLLCHMSQLRQKCLLGFFSQYFSPVTRFAPGRYTNPINRKPIAPPGQIKTPPPLFPLLSHTPSVTQTPPPYSLLPLLTFPFLTARFLTIRLR